MAIIYTNNKKQNDKDGRDVEAALIGLLTVIENLQYKQSVLTSK